MGGCAIELECQESFRRQPSMVELRLVFLEVRSPMAGIRIRGALLQAMIDHQMGTGTCEHDRIRQCAKNTEREGRRMIRGQREQFFQPDS